MNTSTLERTATGAASADLHMLSLLRLTVAGEVLAVPIADVREILEVGRLTPMPRTPPLVRGVMNLRGAVVPVIDLAVRVGRPPITLGRRSCIVVVEARQTDEDGERSRQALVVGLLVDAVHEVFDSPSAEVEAVPTLGTRVPAHFLAGMTRARGAVLGIVSLERLLSLGELGDLIATQDPH